MLEKTATYICPASCFPPTQFCVPDAAHHELSSVSSAFFFQCHLRAIEKIYQMTQAAMHSYPQPTSLVIKWISSPVTALKTSWMRETGYRGTTGSMQQGSYILMNGLIIYRFYFLAQAFASTYKCSLVSIPLLWISLNKNTSVSARNRPLLSGGGRGSIPTFLQENELMITCKHLQSFLWNHRRFQSQFTDTELTGEWQVTQVTMALPNILSREGERIV